MAHFQFEFKIRNISSFGTHLYELIRVEEDACELVGGEESCDEHRAVELLEDDAEVPSVLDLRLEDLTDDVPPLRAPLGALGADGSVGCCIAVGLTEICYNYKTHNPQV